MNKLSSDDMNYFHPVDFRVDGRIFLASSKLYNLVKAATSVDKLLQWLVNVLLFCWAGNVLIVIYYFATEFFVKQFPYHNNPITQFAAWELKIINLILASHFYFCNHSFLSRSHTSS
jgi:hypothetical protein